MFSEQLRAAVHQNYSLFFIHYSFNQKAGLRPCFFAFFDGALLRYRPFYSIVKYE